MERVTDIVNEEEFDWIIEDFFSIPFIEKYCSPHFQFAGQNWFISMRPNRLQRINSVEFFDLRLKRCSSGPSILLRYSLGVKISSGKKFHEMSYMHVFGTQTDTHKNAPKFVLRSEFEGLESELVPDGSLRVFCTLQYPVSREDQNNAKLPEDLESLMLSGDYSDVTIKVKGEDFRLHKNILGARSLFFNAMFKNNIKDNITGIISIDDCQPKVFYLFIHFLYTGKVNELYAEIVYDLYEVANKYQEDHLKNECIKFMMNNINACNFFDLIYFALMHDEKLLLAKASHFFSKNTKEVISDEKWMSFQREYPVCANEMYMKTIDAYQSILKHCEETEIFKSLLVES